MSDFSEMSEAPASGQEESDGVHYSSGHSDGQEPPNSVVPDVVPTNQQPKTQEHEGRKRGNNMNRRTNGRNGGSDVRGTVIKPEKVHGVDKRSRSRDTSGQQPLKLSKHALPTSLDGCPICDRPMEIIAFGECRHYVCYVCALKYRDLYKNTKCIICHVEIERLIVSFPDETNNKIIENYHSPCFMTNTKLVGPIRSLYNPSCPQCDKRFGDSVQLGKHMDTVHKCSYCSICVNSNTQFLSELPLFSKKDLMDHIHTQHTRCTMCSKQFYDIKSYYRHLDEDHFECLPCSNLTSDRIFFSTFRMLRFHCIKAHHVCYHNECFSQDDNGQLVAFAFPNQLADHLEQCHSGYATGEELRQLRKQTINIEQFTRLDDEKERGRDFCIVRREPGNEALVTESKAFSDKFRAEHKETLKIVESLKSNNNSESEPSDTKGSATKGVKVAAKVVDIRPSVRGNRSQDKRRVTRGIPVELDDEVKRQEQQQQQNNVGSDGQRYNRDVWGGSHTTHHGSDLKEDGEPVLEEGFVKVPVWAARKKIGITVSTTNLEDELPVLDEGDASAANEKPRTWRDELETAAKYNRYKQAMELSKPAPRLQPNAATKPPPKELTFEDFPQLDDAPKARHVPPVIVTPGVDGAALRSYVKTSGGVSAAGKSKTADGLGLLEEFGCSVKVVKKQQKRQQPDAVSGQLRQTQQTQHTQYTVHTAQQHRNQRQPGMGVWGAPPATAAPSADTEAQLPTLMERCKQTKAAEPKPQVPYRDIDRAKRDGTTENDNADDLGDFFTRVMRRTVKPKRNSGTPN